MSHLLRGAHIASKQLAYLSIIALTLLLLVIGSLYWLSNAIEQRQGEIAQWLSTKVDNPVTLGSASLEQSGLVPKLHIENLKLLDKNSGDELLSLASLNFGIDIFQSILHGEPVLNDITISGVTASLNRDEQGQLSLKGVTISSGASNKKTNLIEWVDELNQINISTISVHYTDVVHPTLTGQYQLNNAVLNNNYAGWSLLGEFQLPSQVGNLVQFELDISKNKTLDESEWSGVITTSGFNAALISQLDALPITIKSGAVDFNLSARGQGMVLDSANSLVQLSSLQLASSNKQKKNNRSSLMVDSLSAKLDWKKMNDGGLLYGHDINIAMNGETWPETAFTVLREKDDWRVTSDYIKLSDVSSLALLTEKSPEMLRQQQPAGDVQNLKLNFSEKEGLKYLAFELNEVGFLPAKNYPGVSGLTAAVDWKAGVADIAFNSHNVHLYAKPWLKKAVFFDSISGKLNLNTTNEQLQLKTEALRIWNDDLTLQLDGQLERSSAGKIQTDFQLEIENMLVNSWNKYVPISIFQPDLKRWIQPAFVKGKITSGHIALRGDLADFPFDKPKDDGLFKMDLNAENVQLHFAPDWPDLENVTATIHGLGNDLTIKSRHGSIAGFNFVDMTTTIERLMITKPVLRTKGSLAGTTEDGLEFLRQSPLKKRFARAIEGVTAEGKTDINLSLLVPLTNVNSTQAEGDASFKNSRLIHKDFTAVSIDNINGLLKFNNDGVETQKNIEATLLNQAVNVSVAPSKNKTIVTMNGTVASDDINAVWPESVPSFINGQTQYSATLNVKEKKLGEFYVDGGLTSKLRGLSIDLPAPFNKGANETALLNGSMTAENDDTIYKLKISDIVNIVAANKADNWRLGLMIGRGSPTLAEKGNQIDVSLASLSVDEWVTWLDSQPKQDNNVLLSELDNISLKLDSVTGFGQQLTGVDTLMQKRVAGWKIDITSDQTNGRVYWPNAGQNDPATVYLDNLALNLPETSKSTSSKISLWPSIDMSIDQLSLNDILLGRFTLSAQQEINKWRVKSASLQAAHYKISSEDGQWLQTKSTDITSIKVKIESDNLGDDLFLLGFQRAIESDKFEANVDVNFLGSPLDFSRQGLSGKVDFVVGKGKLNDVEPGAAGRVFGLMSVAALPRRLSLDFSDLFSKGFNFDYINSSFAIKDGIATTDDFVVASPSAKVEITGDVDLGDQIYNQQVAITPNVSSTLPLAGAVAAGPVGLGVGTALLVVDKLSGSLFGKNIVNLISYRYSLTGPWDNPKFQALGSSELQ